MMRSNSLWTLQKRIEKCNIVDKSIYSATRKSGKRDSDIVKTLGFGRNTALRIKKRYLNEGLQSALVDKPRPGQLEKYTKRHAAEILVKACTQPPDGSKRWSFTLLYSVLLGFLLEDLVESLLSFFLDPRLLCPHFSSKMNLKSFNDPERGLRTPSKGWGS